MGILKGADQNIIFADIPGLIEGAHAGKGLGDKFLKHIERTKILVHIIDAGSDKIFNDYKTVRNELEKFSKVLLKKEEIVVLSKIDIVSEEDLAKKIKILKKYKISPLAISAVTNKNIDKLVKLILTNLENHNIMTI